MIYLNILWKYKNIILIAILSIILVGFVWSYNNKIDKINSLTIEKTQLEQTLVQKEQIISKMQSDLKLLEQTQNEYNVEKQKILKQKNAAIQKLRKHDLQKLMLAKPNLLEKKINQASFETLNCLQVATGDKSVVCKSVHNGIK